MVIGALSLPLLTTKFTFVPSSASVLAAGDWLMIIPSGRSSNSVVTLPTEYP